jgi:hypothetical protein
MAVQWASAKSCANSFELATFLVKTKCMLCANRITDQPARQM